MHPILHEDMTMYSLVALVQRWRGDSRAETTSRAMFGSPHAGLRHDFPSHFDSFVKLTGGAYGDAETLAENHTPLRYFTAFRTTDIHSRALAAMRGKSAERLKFELGLPASPAGSALPLTFCRACVHAQQSDIGFAYWHRAHHLPSTMICLIHGEPLHKTPLRANGLGRSRLMLPFDAEVISTSQPFELSASGKPILQRLAALSDAILRKPLPGGFDPLSLQSCYRTGLASRNLLTPGGLLRATELLRDLGRHFQPIATLWPFDKLVVPSRNETMLRLVRKPRAGIPTITHLLMIEFLFGTWECFVSAYQWEKQLAPLLDSSTCPSRQKMVVPQHLETALARIASGYQAGEGSLSALCRINEVDLGTAMRWLGRLGLMALPRRPKTVTADIRSKAVALMEDGRPLKEVSLLTGLSKATVDRILNESPSLHSRWAMQNHERKRRTERARLEDFLAITPDATMKSVRNSPGNGHRWLSRYDRQWLSKRVPLHNAKSRALRKPKPRIDWAERDDTCLQALQAISHGLILAAHEIHKAPAILRRLPPLPFKPRLERLPRSRQYVYELITRLRAIRDQRN